MVMSEAEERAKTLKTEWDAEAVKIGDRLRVLGPLLPFYPKPRKTGWLGWRKSWCPICSTELIEHPRFFYWRCPSGDYDYGHASYRLPLL